MTGRSGVRYFPRLGLVFLWMVLAAGAVEIGTKPSRTLEERPGGEISAAAFSADGAYIVAGNEKGWVYSWDATTGEQVGQNHAHINAAVLAMEVYPLGPIAAHASEHGIKFHLIGGQGRVPSFEARHKQTPLTLSFSKDGDHMASADRGGETIVWNLWTGEPERRFQTSGATYSARYHPDGKRLATGSQDGKLRLWDVQANKMLYEVAAHESEIFSTSFSADGKWLASAGKDKKVRIWDAASGKPAGVLEGHEDAVNVVAFVPNNASLLLSGSDDKTVRLWNVAQKKLLQTLTFDHAVNTVSWRPKGNEIAVGSGNLVRFYQVK